MRRISRHLSLICLGATLVVTAATAGCAGRARFYDNEHNDYHAWNHNEDLAYRRFLAERHEQYRDFSKLDGNEQKDYWNWRHTHPDQDRR